MASSARRLGVGDGGLQAVVGGRGGLGALGLERGRGARAARRGRPRRLLQRALGVVGGLLAVHARALEALDARQRLDVGAGGRGLELGQLLAQLLLQLVAQALGLALGGGGAGLGLAARLVELRGHAGGHALEVVDALHRRQQARDHGGGVVEVGDRVAG